MRVDIYTIGIVISSHLDRSYDLTMWKYRDTKQYFEKPLSEGCKSLRVYS